MTSPDPSGDDRVENLWAVVPRLLNQLSYCVLSTADASGTPWCTPVFFATVDCRDLWWVSAAESRHSRNIAVRPQVAIAVFDSTVPVGRAEAVYLTAQAQVCDDVPAALEALNARVPSDHALAVDDMAPRGRLTAYRAAVTRWEILIRGGSATFDNVVDQRHEVRPPA